MAHAAMDERLCAHAQVIGSNDPVFETVALLEYASASAFISCADGSLGEAPEARTAGLRGQWLVASTGLSTQQFDRRLGRGTYPNRSA